jgi:dolichyl-phosphate beta-glucosyltransferase
LFESAGQCPILSIIIPVFNEEKVIDQTLRELEKYFIINEGMRLELIIVNDNSTDKSLKTIKDKFSNRQNIKIINNKIRKGKALCVHDGIMEAKGTYVMFMDADLAVPLHTIDKFLKYMNNGTDVVIGIRDTRGRETIVVRPFYRTIISKIYNMFCRALFFKRRIIDVGCGFKAFKKAVAHDLFSDLYIKSWIFDVEILSKAIEKRYKIAQVPVDWIFKGKSHLNVYKDLIVAGCELIRLKLYLKK